jgi:hypothetical protein
VIAQPQHEQGYQNGRRAGHQRQHENTLLVNQLGLVKLHGSLPN